MLPRIWVSGITFSDGTTLALAKDDIVLIVGPNNSGKSAALRGIHQKVEDDHKQSPVVSSLSLERIGTGNDVVEWIKGIAVTDPGVSPANPLYRMMGRSVWQGNAVAYWPTNALHDLAGFFCHILTAEERLRAANPATAIALVREPTAHPIHALQRDDRLERYVSAQFRKAFGMDLIVHRNAGSEVPLYTGDFPQVLPNQDRQSHEYISQLEQLPTLQSQGDGMKSFAAVLLETTVGAESVLLIDEPEAFLHPPQARLLGQILVSQRTLERQLFLATHSGDFLRGVLDMDSDHVRVVRIRREGGVNRIKQLNNTQMRALWSDPLLRYSNILDGIFHEGVVVTESDADARFFAAVGDALFEETSPDVQKPNVMFTHGGGKARLPMIVSSLHQLDVPVLAVADFDILNNEHPLKELVEATGGQWNEFAEDWKAVKSAVDSKKPELGPEEIRKEILKILENSSRADSFLDLKHSIDNVLRKSSPWATAKGCGKDAVPRGTATQTCDRLLVGLRKRGIFVVEVGELEGFARTVGGHGPAWVNEVLKKDLARDAELENARRFVRDLFAAGKIVSGS